MNCLTQLYPSLTLKNYTFNKPIAGMLVESPPHPHNGTKSTQGKSH